MQKSYNYTLRIGLSLKTAGSKGEMMPKRILWMSRHRPHGRQIEALREKFGSDTIIDLDPRPFDDAREIIRRFKEKGYDEIVVVAPLSVMAIICSEGIKPLWSEAVAEDDPEKIEFRGARGQGFRFVRFRRVKRVILEFEEV